MGVWPERLSQRKRAGSFSSRVDDEDDENATFRDKLERFEKAEKAFSLLVDKLTAYRKALMAAMDLGVDLAQHVEVFFSPPATATQRELAVKFKHALRGGQERWKKKGDKSFEEDVYVPVKGRLDEIPEVRDYIKKRANALSEWQRRVKKLAASNGKNDRRVEEKRKKCEEARVLYRSLHDEVVQRCTNIERNLGNFISPSLRSLVSISADQSRSQSVALSEVENLLKSHPPMTPCLVDDDKRVRENVNEPGEDAENWDAAFSGDIPDKELSGAEPVVGAESSFDIGIENDLAKASAAMNLSDAKPLLERQLSTSVDTSKRPVTNTSVGTSQTSRSTTSSDPALSEAITKVLPNISGHTGEKNGVRKPSADTFVSEMTDDTSQNSVNDVLAYRVVQFDFDPREANEMKIRVGDVVEVQEMNASKWWTGRCGNYYGLFPENYTRAMTEEEELAYIHRRQSRQKNRHSHRRGHRQRDSRDSHLSIPLSTASGRSRRSAPILQ